MKVWDQLSSDSSRGSIFLIGNSSIAAAGPLPVLSLIQDSPSSLPWNFTSWTIQQDIIFYRLGKPSYSESSSFQPFSSSRLRFRFIFLHLFPGANFSALSSKALRATLPEDIPMGLDKLDQLTDVTIQPLFGGQKESVGERKIASLKNIHRKRGRR